MKANPFISAVFGTTLTGITAFGQTTSLTVVSPAQVAITQPLRNFHDTEKKNQEVHLPKPLPKHDEDKKNGSDDAVQSKGGGLTNANPGVRFPGVGANGSAPPDTNMAVGPHHIVQTVNANYAVYSKTGALILGPNSLSSLWSPLGNTNPCATSSAGDVVAQYDKLADRWVITQLGGQSAPFSECIAVSQTADPTGQYFLYSFSYGSTLNDYPKFGVWPTTTNSAYLASYNLFANGSTFTGGQLCAYDRTKMLAGNSTAQGICYTINNDGGFLPSDLDGSAAPVDGTPGYFLNFETTSSLRMYALSPNFANPSASTLTQIAPDLAVTAFTEACGGGTCVPQLGTTQKLDSLGDRLMYRLAFRIFGDHEAMVVNHSVATGTSVGVRWYELRSPISSNASFSMYQQATFAPDSSYRWMGSAAMDRTGDIGLGYSASSGSLHPAIRYTGRLWGDPLGTMESESSILEGTGSQTGGLARWGDYTAMRIDPADDCTFWYTNEYLQSNGSFNWSTAFGSFKFSSCTAADFSISANPTSLTLNQGQTGTSTVTLASLNGFNSAVGLSLSGCPSASCSLNPISVAPTQAAPATSTLTVATTSATAAGPFTITITGTDPSGSPSHATIVSGTVNACTYAVAPSSQNFPANGGTGSISVTTGAGCTWMVASNAPWITFPAGATGTGSGSVSYSVASNTGAQRSGGLTFASR